MPSPARTPLSRDRILAAAVELADEHGVEALTMRKLAEGLGFEAMSLYRHVANKDDLLDGMLDVVIAEWEVPPAAGDWADAVRRSAVSVHDALSRHRWAAKLLLAPGHLRPARVRYMDALLGRLRGAGLSADTTYVAYHVLDAHIFGFSLWETSHTWTGDTEELVARLMREVPWEELPHLAEHRDQHMADGPHREVRSFEFGLDLILAGLGGRALAGDTER